MEENQIISLIFSVWFCKPLSGSQWKRSGHKYGLAEGQPYNQTDSFAFSKIIWHNKRTEMKGEPLCN